MKYSTRNLIKHMSLDKIEENFEKIITEAERLYNSLKEANCKFKDEERGIKARQEIYELIESAKYENITKKELQEDGDEYRFPFNEQLRLYSLIVDISNNLAHGLKNYGAVADNFDVKSNAIFELEKSIQEYSKLKKIDIISGYQIDNSKEKNTLVYVLDIPGYGQVSWHMNHFQKREYEERGVKLNEYPFELANRDQTNSSFLTRHTGTLLNAHDAIDISAQEGDENYLRNCLDLYYSYYKTTTDEKLIEYKIKEIAQMTELSPQLTEKMSKVINVPYQRVVDERKVIKQQKIQQELEVK